MDLTVLPDDIVDTIVDFVGLKLRNGVYMMQIAKNDARYVQLATVPREITYHDVGFMLLFWVESPKIKVLTEIERVPVPNLYKNIYVRGNLNKEGSWNTWTQIWCDGSTRLRHSSWNRN